MMGWCWSARTETPAPSIAGSFHNMHYVTLPFGDVLRGEFAVSDRAARRMLRAGWGGRDRTSEWRNQNPLPYRLATPQPPAVNRAAPPVRKGGRRSATRSAATDRPPAPPPRGRRTARSRWRPTRSSAPAGSPASRARRRQHGADGGCQRPAPAARGRCACRQRRRQRRRVGPRAGSAVGGRERAGAGAEHVRRRHGDAGVGQQHAAGRHRPAAADRSSPIPVMRAGRLARQTGTSAPSASAMACSVSWSGRSSHRRHSSRSAAAASAEPPPMPDATGRCFSSTRRRRRSAPAQAASARAARSTRLSGSACSPAANGPATRSDRVGRRSHAADRPPGRTRPGCPASGSRRRGAR